MSGLDCCASTLPMLCILVTSTLTFLHLQSAHSFLLFTLLLVILLEPQRVKLCIYLIKTHITCTKDTGSLESTYTSFSNDSSLSSFLAISPLISGWPKERKKNVTIFKAKENFL